MRLCLLAMVFLLFLLFVDNIRGTLGTEGAGATDLSAQEQSRKRAGNPQEEPKAKRVRISRADRLAKEAAEKKAADELAAGLRERQRKVRKLLEATSLNKYSFGKFTAHITVGR